MAGLFSIVPLRPSTSQDQASYRGEAYGGLEASSRRVYNGKLGMDKGFPFGREIDFIWIW